MRVAIVHDWLVVYSGSERVLEQIINVFPQADLYSLIEFIPQDQRKFIQEKRVFTSFIQKLPKAHTQYRAYLPLMPIAIEQFDFSSYDLVISCSHAVSKGIITSPTQLHICFHNGYMHYAWDQQNVYLKESGLSKLGGNLTRYFLHYMRIWDYQASQRPDVNIANSRFMASILRKLYKREAHVINPPVDVDLFEVSEKKEPFYVTVARLVPIKKVGLIVQTFKQLDKELIVIGDGPEMETIKRIAGRKTHLLGFQPSKVIRQYLQKARAFVFASNEPFGIVTLEAQACGTPVIAYGRGGALETVVADRTGIFFDEQTSQSLASAVERFEQMQFDPVVIRQNAERFSAERFRREFKAFVENAWAEFQAKL